MTKKLKEVFKKIDYRHYICSAIILTFLLLTIFFRQDNYVRIGQAFEHLWSSIKYLFGASGFQEYDEVTGISNIILPKDGLHFLVLFKVFSGLTFNWDFFVLYILDVFLLLINILKVIIWLPIIIIWFVLIKKLVLSEKSEEIDGPTRPMKWYIGFETKVIRPVRTYIREFFSFFWKYYKIFIILLVLLLLNIYAIGIDLLSWYLSFLKSFDLSSLFNVLVYVVFDILVAIKTDLWLVIIIGVIALHMLRINSAIKQLEKMQLINEERAEQLGIATLVTAPPGTGKTTLVSSLTTDLDKNFRTKAFDIIKKYQLLFPNFPWQNLESYIHEETEARNIVNRAQLKENLNELWKSYIDEQSDTFFNYNTELYPLLVHDGVKYLTLIEAVIPYAEAYFLYFSGKPLVFGNFSIRCDYQREGYFPLYDYDYINRDKKEEYSHRYINITNFDSRRILNRLNDTDSANYYQMDGQVEAYTEIDKERGNREDHIGLDKTDYEANQRNDGFNKSVKLTRHEFTIDNIPFTKLLVDCQREYSVNADLREACEDRIRIKERGQEKITLPFFVFDYLFCVPIMKRYQEYYYEFRSLRKDITLYNYLYSKLIHRLALYYYRICNLYCFRQLFYNHERGATATEEGTITRENYFFINQKVYSGLFSTDAYSEFFDNKRMDAEEGFLDAKEYSSVKPSVDELKLQESYWINELIEITDMETNKKRFKSKKEEK